MITWKLPGALGYDRVYCLPSREAMTVAGALESQRRCSITKPWTSECEDALGPQIYCGYVLLLEAMFTTGTHGEDVELWDMVHGWDLAMGPLVAIMSLEVTHLRMT